MHRKSHENWKVKNSSHFVVLHAHYFYVFILLSIQMCRFMSRTENKIQSEMPRLFFENVYNVYVSSKIFSSFLLIQYLAWFLQLKNGLHKIWWQCDEKYLKFSFCLHPLPMYLCIVCGFSLSLLLLSSMWFKIFIYLSCTHENGNT